MWSAVAAADRLRACARASDNFLAQSGRTLSVVMTEGAVADSDVALRREVPDPKEDEEDMADAADASRCPDP